MSSTGHNIVTIFFVTSWLQHRAHTRLSLLTAVSSGDFIRNVVRVVLTYVFCSSSLREDVTVEILQAPWSTSPPRSRGMHRRRFSALRAAIKAKQNTTPEKKSKKKSCSVGVPRTRDIWFVRRNRSRRGGVPVPPDGTQTASCTCDRSGSL